MDHLQQYGRHFLAGGGPLVPLRWLLWCGLISWTLVVQPASLLFVVLVGLALTLVALLRPRAEQSRAAKAFGLLSLAISSALPLLTGGWLSPWSLDGWMALTAVQRPGSGRQRLLNLSWWLVLDGTIALWGGTDWYLTPLASVLLPMHLLIPVLLTLLPQALPVAGTPAVLESRLITRIQSLAQRFEQIEAAVGPDSAGREATALLEAHLKAIQGSGEARSLLSLMTPQGEVPPDIITRIQAIVTQRQQQTQLLIQLRSTGVPHTLPQVVDDTLAHVVFEALSNVEKHARATQVEIDLRADAEDLVLVIRDNGIGLPDGTPDRPGCHGLRALRYRIQELNGLMDVYEGAQGGLVVQVSLPLNVYAI